VARAFEPSALGVDQPEVGERHGHVRIGEHRRYELGQEVGMPPVVVVQGGDERGGGPIDEGQPVALGTEVLGVADIVDAGIVVAIDDVLALVGTAVVPDADHEVGVAL
jgi:hypothetical protein